MLAANWYASLLLIAIVWAEIARVVDGKPVLVNALFIILIPIALFAFSWFRTQKIVEKNARAMSELQATASLDSIGVHVTTASGATSFSPWSDFSGWKEGPGVFTLSRGKTVRVFPKRGLGAGGEEEVRSLLQSNVS